MRLSEAEAIRERACLDKVRYGRTTAQAIPSQFDHDGRPLRAYKCPFAEDDHWHVGHLLSIEGMTAMAEAVRVLAGCGPGSEPGTIPKRERRRLRKAQRRSPAPPLRPSPPDRRAALRGTERLSAGDREFVEAVGLGFDRMKDAYVAAGDSIRQLAEVWVGIVSADRIERTRSAVQSQRRRRGR